MATYNRSHLIKESLHSISNQTYSNWECIVIDDGSKDATAEVVQHFASDDERYKYFHRTRRYRKGLPGCRNMGLDLASGKYVVFFDDDDIVHPENLRINAGILQDSHFRFCRYDKEPFFDELPLNINPNVDFTIRRFETGDITKMINGVIPFASCCVLWDRRCFDKHRFNESLMYAEEWECYTRILSDGFTGASINSVLYFNRKHVQSNTGQYREKNPIQLGSQIDAAELIIEKLAEKGLFNKQLEKFFIRMGFDHNSLKIIELSLESSGSGLVKKIKYKLGYFFYPVLNPIFRMKLKFKKT